MRSFTLQPIVSSTTRMSGRQDHDEIHAQRFLENSIIDSIFRQEFSLLLSMELRELDRSRGVSILQVAWDRQ